MKINIWNDIFDKYQIIDKIHKDGKFEITSNTINEFREARLMTKFDNASQLPEIFTENKLSILPITRGSYIIAPMDIFAKFPEVKHHPDIQYVKFPEHIQSLVPSNITSEASALNGAYLSGILSDFIDDEDISPTINGRMSSSSFDFNVKSSLTNELIPINVNNAQIEIDGGYEGAEFLSIIEAKNNLADDFVIRQLYYPMRLWSSNISKEIKTIFMVYTNGIFYLYEYKFRDINDYNSLIINKMKRYAFDKIEITLADIERLLAHIETLQEPDIPFPQADSFDRVINLCELLNNNHLSKDDITIEYGFDSRQTDYYFNAGKYLGLMINGDREIMLTEEGRKIMSMPPRAKQLAFASTILRYPVFNEVLKQNLKSGNMPNKNEVIGIMKKHPLYNVKKDSTYTRRASTVISWIDWITSLING